MDNDSNDFKILVSFFLIVVVLVILYVISPVLLKYTVLLSLVVGITYFILNKLSLENALLVYRNKNKKAFYCVTILSYLLLSFLFALKFSFLDVFIFTTFIVSTICLRIELLLKKRNKIIEEEKEFFLQYPEIAEKYKSALEILDQKGKNYTSYKELANTLLEKTKNLYFTRKKTIEDKKSITAIKIELEDLINDAETKNDKISMLQKRLEKIQRKEVLYSNYIDKTQEAIESTKYDYVGIKADIELVAADTTKQIKIDNKALDEKSKTLTYLQENLPLLEEDDDNSELIDSQRNQ